MLPTWFPHFHEKKAWRTWKEAYLLIAPTPMHELTPPTSFASCWSAAGERAEWVRERVVTERGEREWRERVAWVCVLFVCTNTYTWSHTKPPLGPIKSQHLTPCCCIPIGSFHVTWIVLLELTHVLVCMSHALAYTPMSFHFMHTYIILIHACMRITSLPITLAS